MQKAPVPSPPSLTPWSRDTWLARATHRAGKIHQNAEKCPNENGALHKAAQAHPPVPPTSRCCLQPSAQAQTVPLLHQPGPI